MNEDRKPKGYWTEEKCLEEARKYKTVREFRVNSESAYATAVRNNWLRNYTWLSNLRLTPIKSPGYWTEERCTIEAKKYSTLIEFINGSYSAYRASKTNKWLDKFTWLEKRSSNSVGYGYWTYEKCYELAKKCNTRLEFENLYKQAYKKASSKNWLKDYTWFKEIRHIWSKEEVANIARKYKYKKDFRTNDKKAYKVADKNGWMKEFDWLESKPAEGIDINKRSHLIYGYFDFSNKVCYIGLTMNIKNRHRQHKKRTK